MTARALKVIAGSEYVIGNAIYLDPLEPLLTGKNVIRSSMGKEVERAKKAIELAQSHTVAIVSGGTPVSMVWQALSLKSLSTPAHISMLR